MRTGAVRLLMVAVMVTLAGCATSGSGGSGTSRDVMTLEEIEAANQRTAYELIEVNRPWWLRKRGATSWTRDNPIMVYMYGTRIGDLEELRAIPALEIRELRFLSPAKAQARFGSGNPAGAIEVIPKQ